MPSKSKKKTNNKSKMWGWSGAGCVIGFAIGFLLLDSVVSGIILGAALGVAMSLVVKEDKNGIRQTKK